jgi:acyl-CoA synthetase (AMP-forming)/AMP-acid ligase II
MEPRTVPQLVEACATRYADREAVVDGDVRLTFAALGDRITRFGRALVGHGVRPGDRVAVWAPNGLRWITAALGAVCAGAVLVPLNTRFKGGEAGYVLRHSRARLLVTENGFLGNDYVAMLRDEELPDLSVVTQDTWDEFLAGAPDGPLPEVGPDDPADIFFTSGTTGSPKGAVLAHGQVLRMYATWSELAGLGEGDRYLVVNPFFHTFGYKAGLLASLLRGATVVPLPVFDVAATLELVARERITVLPGPPALYTSILGHPDRARYDLSSLRVAVTGAAVVPVALIERMRAELTFDTILTAYGLTECGGTATMCRAGDDAVTVATTSGRAIPGMEVRVDAPAGEPGEVLVRGYGIMRGYFADEAATRSTVDPDGWLRTGDIGVLDGRGYLRITDRLKDMYIVGGFNTYPAEIEQALARHEKVAEAAVVGVPDERLGEVGKAFVVPRPGATVTPAELVGFCRERLANYKVPREVVLVAALPRNASGKVVKAQLREGS